MPFFPHALRPSLCVCLSLSVSVSVSLCLSLIEFLSLTSYLTSYLLPRTHSCHLPIHTSYYIAISLGTNVCDRIRFCYTTLVRSKCHVITLYRYVILHVPRLSICVADFPLLFLCIRTHYTVIIDLYVKFISPCSYVDYEKIFSH